MKPIRRLCLLSVLWLAGAPFAAWAAGSDGAAPVTATQAAAPATADSAQEPAPKRAYMLIEARITDMARFGRYTQAIIPIVQRHGGRYIVMRGARETLEGDYGDTRVVVSEWPSLDAARAFWNDPEYREAVKLREGTGEFRILLMEGVDPAPAVAP
jgi:uncharacterized protein (DUF1330 family)